MRKKRPPYNLKSQVRSALRKVWQWSPHRRQALEKARVAYGRYQCAECKAVKGPRDVAVDHIDACGGFSDNLMDLGQFAHRLYFNPLQVLCKEPCHKAKTKRERAEATARRKAA